MLTKKTTNWTEKQISVKQDSERKKNAKVRKSCQKKKKKQEIINNASLLKNLTEKKKKTWHEQMTADKGLKENDNLKGLCEIVG